LGIQFATRGKKKRRLREEGAVQAREIALLTMRVLIGVPVLEFFGQILHHDRLET
jgi:hypothetical protein